MENNVYLQVEGLFDDRSKDKIIKSLSQMPGIELIHVDSSEGLIQLSGGDIDQLEVEDIVESLGFRTMP